MVRSAVRCWPAWLVVLAGLAAGCAPGKGSISGRVTFNKTPVASGRISFHSEVGNHEVFNAVIKDGKYSIDGVTAGKARVSVISTTPVKGGDLKKGRGTQTVSTLPPRYADADKSNLSLTVQSGSQDFPVDLEP
jgi:hypothetical protein